MKTRAHTFRALCAVATMFAWTAPLAVLGLHTASIDAKKKKGGGSKKAKKEAKKAAAQAPAQAAASAVSENESLDAEVAAAERSDGYGRWRTRSAFKELGEDYEFPPVRHTPSKPKSVIPAPGPAAGGEGSSEEPRALIRLASAPILIPPPGDAQKKGEAAKGSAALAQKRQSELKRRDGSVLPTENLSVMPTQFCVRGRCMGSYSQVAAALYGGAKGANPVFCAPARVGGASGGNRWSSSRVDCSTRWLSTLGKWQPWTQNGQASPPPEPGALPPYACFGSPHLIKAHMLVPGGGAAGQSGFQCRKRVFRILASSAEKNQSDVNRRIALMCAEMRMQVWGEKYPDINKQYQQWCRSDPKRVKAGICLPPGTALPGPGESPLPFMQLAREELLYFFGHQELFCRADRKGLTHMLYNKPWAQTFTCAVPRGLIEAGPFEEGVQTCALSPFVGEEKTSSLSTDTLKARLHCWQFNRPTCEEVSRDQTRDDLHKSHVFDVYDSLREARRTRDKNVWALFDLKDAEKIADFDESRAFGDTAKDESTFGVSDFCRFAGGSKTLRCGYKKDTMAQWYALRKDEAPAGCKGAFCARGQYQRGYYCGLFASRELFENKPYWMCGIDSGLEGRKLLGNARAVCVGGVIAKKFQGASGSRSSLQCYERRFRWGEWAKSEDILRRFRWDLAVKEAAKVAPKYDYWLGWIAPPKNINKGSKKKKKKRRAAHERANAKSSEEAKARLLAAWAKDAKDLTAWAAKNPAGHGMGHRTTLREALLRGGIPSLRALLAKKFPDKALPAAPVKKKKKKKKKKQVQGPPPKTTANPLNALISELARGERAADGQWYEAFRLEASEEGRRQISEAELQLALRVHHMFEVLEGARRIYLATARDYADALFEGVKKRPYRTRAELQDEARTADLAPGMKGRMFCVTDADKLSPTGQREYVCGTAAMLVPGNVERWVADKWQNQWASRAPMVREKLRAKLRARVSFGWCYGGSIGAALDPAKLPAALTLAAPSSPYQMEIPPAVVTKSKSNTGWLKCAGFQYSDELWEQAPPPAQLPTLLAKGKKGGKAAGKTAKIMKMVGGLLGALSRLALPGFGDALKRVQDLVHIAGSFYDKWVGKFAEKARPFWEKLQEAIKGAQGEIEEAERVAEEKRTAYHQAEVFAAGAQGPAKEQADEKKAEALTQLKDAQKTVKEKKRALADLKKNAKKGKGVPGTGELLSSLLEDLVKMASDRVMAVVEPNARNLLQKGFKFVRSILDPIAKSVISALGSVPFVGGALAALGQMAFTMALDALENLGFQALKGIVERLLAKLLRGVMTPILKVAQDKIVALAFQFCAKLAPDVCSGDTPVKFGALPPQDAWLERALACAPPIIDDRIHKDAAVARAEVMEVGVQMRRESVALARELADQYLARYGMTLDTWMAAVGQGATPAFASRASQVVRDLQSEAKALRAQREANKAR